MRQLACSELFWLEDIHYLGLYNLMHVKNHRLTLSGLMPTESSFFNSFRSKSIRENHYLNLLDTIHTENEHISTAYGKIINLTF